MTSNNDTEDDIRVGANLRKIRNARNVSQEKLAEAGAPTSNRSWTKKRRSRWTNHRGADRARTDDYREIVKGMPRSRSRTPLGQRFNNVGDQPGIS